MSNKLKQIAAILANDDVRDPRATLRAIEQVVVAKVSKGAKPVAVIKVFDNPESKGALKTTVSIEYSDSRIEPRHMKAAVLAIKDFAGQRAAEECNEPDCPVHGNEGDSILSELFKQFEEAALKGRRKEDRA